MSLLRKTLFIYFFLANLKHKYFFTVLSEVELKNFRKLEISNIT